MTETLLKPPQQNDFNALLSVNSIQSLEKLQVKPKDRKFYSSGAWYIGNLQKSQRIGWGQFKLSKGGFYEGYFKDNNRHGEGRHYLSDGSKYVGSFKNNLRHGYGELTWKNGETYEGLFSEDKRHGYGVYKWPDGRFYEGNFQKNMKCGFGVYHLSNGDRFEGIYQNDQRDGPGVFSYKSSGYQDIGIWKGPLLIKICSTIPNSFSYKHFLKHHINAAEDKNAKTNLKSIGESKEKVKNHKIGKDEKEKVNMKVSSGELKNEEESCNVNVPVSFPYQDIINGNRPQEAPSGPIEIASTKLLLASSNGDYILVRGILEKGLAHPDVSDNTGYFSILGAAVNCHTDILDCLLDHGADVNRLNDEKLSALSACHLLFYSQESFIDNIAENMSLKENFFNSVEFEPKTGTIINRNERKVIMAIYEAERLKNIDYDLKPGLQRKRRPQLDGRRHSQSSKSSKASTFKLEAESISEEEENEGYVDLWKMEYYQKSMDRVKEIEEINRTFKDFMLTPYSVPIEKLSNNKLALNHLDYNEKNSQDQRVYQRRASTTAGSVLGYGTSSRTSKFQAKNRPATTDAVNQMFRKHISNERKPHIQNIIALLLKRGANPNSSSLPMPPLFFALKSADPDAVAALVDQHADTSAKLDGVNLCPLHIAVALPTEKGIQITKILLEHGADPNLRDSYLDNDMIDGRTPLHIVCCREDDYNDAEKIARLLLQYGADPNLLCLGNCALSLAIASGNDLIIDTLLKYNANPSLKLTHGLGSVLCTATSFQAERKRAPIQRMELIEKLVHAGGDMLTPVRISDKYPPCTVVDYAHHVFLQDRRIACTPYHALSSLERECYNARKLMFEKLGVYMRSATKIKERKLLMADIKKMEQGNQDSNGKITENPSNSKRRKSTNLVGRDESCGLRFVNIKIGTRVVPYEENGETLTIVLHSIKRLRYCYDCGRSIAVRLTPCTRCKEVFYCSKICKTKAWSEVHREECNRLTGQRHSSSKNRSPCTLSSRDHSKGSFLPQI